MAELKPSDTVLEIGPGKGALTESLANTAKTVIAVELDEDLAKALAGRYKNLKVLQADILKFDFNELPTNYKLVANIPYYLSGQILRLIGETSNPPSMAVLLVQKEVAERLSAQPGQMSILAVAVQYYFEAELGKVVPAHSFEPQPKVDSQIVKLTKRKTPLFSDIDAKIYFRLVKAGFSSRRKKLRSSLSGGLGISKSSTDKMLLSAKVDGNLRAQNLDLADWYKLYNAYAKIQTS